MTSPTSGRAMPPESILLLVNDQAGGRASRRRARDAVARLRRLLGAEARDAGRPEEFRNALRAADPTALPVAVGGDGTLNMLVAAVLAERGTGQTVGVVPVGTANLLAEDVGIADVDRAIEALGRGESRSIDVMRTDRSDMPLALVSLSAGFEGRFMEGFRRTRRLGRATGAVRGLVGGLGRRDAVGLEADGETLTGGGEAAFAAGLYNTPRYAGKVVMVPGAVPDDGLVDARVYPSMASWAGPFLRGLSRQAPIPSAGTVHRQCRTATLRTGGPIQVDGEVRAGGEVRVEVVPSAVRVVAPLEG